MSLQSLVNTFSDDSIGLNVTISVCAKGGIKKKKSLRFRAMYQDAVAILQAAGNSVPKKRQEQLVKIVDEIQAVKRDISKNQLHKVFSKSGLDLNNPAILNFLQQQIDNKRMGIQPSQDEDQDQDQDKDLDQDQELVE